MDETFPLILRGICRGLHLAGYFTAFGTIFLPAVLLRENDVRGLRRMAWAGFSLALLAGIGWFVLQTADFASADNLADTLSATPSVMFDTRFGTLLSGRLA